ncbi:MAG: hypothetical protein ACLUW6_01370 [Coriobacteriaceae bacterium]
MERRCRRPRRARLISALRERASTTVGLYTHGQTSWTPDQFLQFLSERIMSPARRDIERLLFRCGLSEYGVFKIADATRAINPRDELWPRPPMLPWPRRHGGLRRHLPAAHRAAETASIRRRCEREALRGEPGRLRHREAAHQPLSTDVESEVAASLLAEMLGMPCCRAWRFGDDAVFSAFEYDFTCEYLVHMRRLFDGPRGENELENLLAVRPQYADDLYRMIAFDFITRQDDRHLSNIAVLVTEGGEVFYPLYDNGRSLFYEDTESFARKAAADPRAFATTFGYVGTYWDHARDIAAKGVRFGDLLNLDVDERTVRQLLVEAGFTDYRLEAATEWIMNAVECLKSLG